MTAIKVLILEDYRFDAELLVNQLTEAGFNLDSVVAKSRADYLDKLDESLDIILADFDLPGFSGREALELLNARDWDIPFILVSGALREEVAIACMREGAADYLFKDNLSRLVPAIHHALEQKNVRQLARQVETENSRLASLVGESPNPVMRANPEGQLLFANAASHDLLQAWGVEVGQVIPGDIGDRVRNSYAAEQAQDVDIELDAVSYALTLAPVLAAEYINIYATNITKQYAALRQTEQLNAMLDVTVREIFTINEIGESLASAIDPSTVYQVVYEKIIEGLLQNSSLAVFHHEPDQATLSLVFAHAGLARQDVSGLLPRDLNEDAISDAIRSGRPKSVDSQLGWDPLVSWAGDSILAHGVLGRSTLVVPMVHDNRVEGGLLIFSPERFAYDDSDLGLLTTIASQMGAMIANRRLAQANDAYVAALEREEQRFRLIFHESLDAILLVNGQTGEIVYVNEACTRHLGYDLAEAEHLNFQDLLPEQPEEIFSKDLGWFKLHGEVFPSQSILTRAGSVLPMDMTVAIISWDGDQAVMLTLRDVTERRVSEALTEQRLRERETLQLASAAANRATSPDQLFSQMTSILNRGLDGSTLGICTPDESGQYLRPDTAHPDPGGTPDLDLAKRELWDPQLEVISRPTLAEHSWTFIRLEGRILGAIHRNSETPMSAESQILLQTVAGHMATALSKLGYVDQIHHRNRELALINRVLSSTIERAGTEHLYEGLAREIAEAFEVSSVSIAMANHARTQLEVVATYGSTGDASQLDLLSAILAADREAGARMLDMKQLTIDNQFEHAGATIDAGPAEGDPLFLALMMIPVRMHGETHGLIALHDHRGRKFSGTDETMAANAVSAVAQLLEKTQLYQQTQAQADNLAWLNLVGQEMTRHHEFDTLCQNVIRQLKRQFGELSVAIYLDLPESPGAHWIHGPLSDPIRNDHVRTSNSTRRSALDSVLAGGDLIRQQTISLAPGSSNGQGSEFEWVVPIKSDAQLLGAIHLICGESRTAEKLDSVLLRTVAKQLALALEKASLFEQSARRALELDILNQITIEGLNIHEHLTETHGQVELLATLMQVDYVYISLWNETLNKPEPYAATRATVQAYSQISVPDNKVTLTEVVLRSGEPLIIPDLQDPTVLDGHFRPELPGRSLLAVPLFSGADWLGAIIMVTQLPHTFSAPEVNLARQAADQIGLSLSLRQTLSSIKRRSEELEALRQANLVLASELEVEPLSQAILNQVYHLMNADGVHIFFYDGENIEFGAAYRMNRLHDTPIASPRKDGITARVARSGQSIVIESARGHELCADWEWDGAIAALPIIHQETVVGVMNVSYDSPHRFGENDLRVLHMFADQTAIALNNANLYTENQRALTKTKSVLAENALLFESMQELNQEVTGAYDATIQGWAKALELRDYETKGHADRVTQLSVQLAELMGIEGDALIQTRRGALLHDVGKMGIPDNILFKEGKLTAEEWSTMKLHVDYAYDWLSGIPYLQPALDIPLCHHEKWDGTGYPRGLAGTEIPLAARVFSIVDVWDALRSERPYRGPWSEEKVINYIRDLSGVQFDPDVVVAFFSIVAPEIELSGYPARVSETA